MKKVEHSGYLPCLNCLLFVKKDQLWRHNRTCPNRRLKENPNRKLQYEATLLLNPSEDSDKAEFFKDIISHMRMDGKSLIVKSGALLRYGVFLHETAGPTKRGYISQKLRMLARLLIEVKKLQVSITGQNDADLSSFIAPNYFDSIVKGTKRLTEYALKEDTAQEMKTPSLALKIGYSLGKVVGLEKGYALKSKDKAKVEDVDAFIHLMNTEWSTRISHVAHNTMAENNYNKVEVLPITEDLLLLRQYTITKLRELTEVLNRDKTNTEAYRELEEVTVTRIVVINRRRSTEGAKITLDQFENRPKWREHRLSEIQGSLTALELELCKR